MIDVSEPQHKANTEHHHRRSHTNRYRGPLHT